MTHDIHSRETLETGLKLGQILSDSLARESFVADPAASLPEAGLSSDMTVYADTADTVHLVVPAGIDASRLAKGDDAYLEELGRQALGACLYEDLPK
ncbi:hypothetical protein [Roseibium aggregatum]|uniref:Uncharacterized protein n=1 Tax=Roseibium aggregatum TaxID=187304 RepID=A0A926S8K2_9HYPH|nr:hypothetical protein [Roseibium aggregatum]MBD1548842.1 hypothetical protein [Roseibium aggregatum]